MGVSSLVVLLSSLRGVAAPAIAGGCDKQRFDAERRTESLLANGSQGHGTRSRI